MSSPVRLLSFYPHLPHFDPMIGEGEYCSSSGLQERIPDLGLARGNTFVGRYWVQRRRFDNDYFQLSAMKAKIRIGLLYGWPVYRYLACTFQRQTQSLRLARR